jgi:hypothetical protein
VRNLGHPFGASDVAECRLEQIGVTILKDCIEIKCRPSRSSIRWLPTSAAASLLPAFTAIPNMPVAVTNSVVAALGSPSQFAVNIAQVRPTLFTSAMSTSVLGGLPSAL